MLKKLKNSNGGITKALLGVVSIIVTMLIITLTLKEVGIIIDWPKFITEGISGIKTIFQTIKNAI